jgi:hypothetical protein
MKTMILVNEYRCDLIDTYNLEISSKFMDELEKWDNTVSRHQLYNMFYTKDVLDMLLSNII